MTTLDWLADVVPPPCADHRMRAEARQLSLTKPPGSLGRLESLATELAAIQRRDDPRVDHAAIIVFAGDHGVTAQGVSAFPSDVTVQMLANFVAGGAAISVLARAQDVPLTVVDAGTLAEAQIAGVVTDKPRCGTDDFYSHPAMTSADMAHACAAGRRAFQATGCRELLILGEMGIGNTTSAAAIGSALLGVDAGRLVGAGTGLDTDGQKLKSDVVAFALARSGLEAAQDDVPRVLQEVGGLEIAALVGAMVAGAQAGVAILVDGFIVTAAALAAVRINPGVRPYLIFSHRSHEQGHGILLDALDAAPLLALDMRLGEGSGAALALPLLRHACALHNEMATFAEAAVSRSD